MSDDELISSKLGDRLPPNERPYFAGKKLMQELLEDMEEIYGLGHEGQEALLGALACCCLSIYAVHDKREAERIIRQASGIALGWITEYRASGGEI